MRPPRRQDAEDLPDLTPMIDIVFLLIVFFMTVAKMEEAERIEIDVPIADKAVAPDERRGRLTLTIDRAGDLYAGAAPVRLENLAARIAERKEANPDLRVYLRADAEVEYSEVREVFEAATEGGVPNVIFAAYQSDK